MSSLEDFLPIKQVLVGGSAKPVTEVDFVGFGASSSPDGKRLTLVAGTEQSALNTTSQLLALNTGALANGAAIRVNAQRDTWVLRKNAGLSAVPGQVLVVGSDAWVRGNVADPSWIRQSAWFIHPTLGDDNNTGASYGQALRTFGEFLARTSRNFNLARAIGITVNVLGSITEDVHIDAQFNATPTGASALILDGSSAATAVASGTISAVTPHDPDTNTPGSITASVGGWGTHAGRIGKVTSGPREGARFVVVGDMGSDEAQISSVCLGQYDVTPVVLEVGDEIEIYSQPQFASSLVAAGFGAVSLQDLAVGVDPSEQGHAVSIYGVTVSFDSCVMNGGLNSDRSAYVDAVNSSIGLGARAQNYGTLILSGGCFRNGQPIARSGGTLWSYNHTSLGRVRVEPNGTLVVGEGYWLSVFGSAGGLVVNPAGVVDMRGGRLWGADISAPRVDVKPGGTLYYSTGGAPNLAGSGAEISVGGSGGATTFAALPSFNTNNGAAVVEST